MNSDAESSTQSSPLTSRDLSICLYNNSPGSESILEMKRMLANLTVIFTALYSRAYSLTALALGRSISSAQMLR
ncbi:hypothetical protein DdX_07669 [Ditylenchus destructor]|uniref:Uncharacterized protein n=1 Tax=Ditylenchus destructor TaxID=166010 RepID=A0AAD4N7A9_9BILA|nr:hypothetical protein DdX_07669 [Ditylenchus destructor]